MIPEKFYKSLSICFIVFEKVTNLDILTHLITEYAELEGEDVQEIDQNMKEPISGESLFEEFVKQIEWNQKELAVKNPYSPNQIVSMAYTITAPYS